MNDRFEKSSSSADNPDSPEPAKTAALSFDLNAEVQRLRAEDAWKRGRNSKTLVKYADFRVVLTVLKSGERLPDHKTPGRISIQTCSGHLRTKAAGAVFDLPAGHLLGLDREVVHDVEALEDSAFLLTIALPENHS